ncbi:UNVERIFIED_CONTAM: hypothetical protein Slati_2192800 [Sesamum latifolium]|uniref:Aminotransferase-like plant mobile domain-containing protein n=1 Tax=Sesamum latifolium TaxID=2727402 RepID=A0AAW2WXM7_9LAMI
MHPLSVVGTWVRPLPRLTNFFYLDEWSQEISLNKNVKAWTLRATHHELPRHQQSNDLIPLRTLGRSIVEGDAKWDGDPIYRIFITPKDWSGLKMCLAVAEGNYASMAYDPSTLHRLLMIIIPISSSKYLLYAYHLLQGADDDQCSNVSIDKWVKFWSKKAIKYHLPPPRKEKKTVRPKSTHNPSGNLKEEVYLAAYLACWLCTFVLPNKDVNSIRPSTFKMASMMASGR